MLFFSLCIYIIFQTLGSCVSVLHSKQPLLLVPLMSCGSAKLNVANLSYSMNSSQTLHDRRIECKSQRVSVNQSLRFRQECVIYNNSNNFHQYPYISGARPVPTTIVGASFSRCSHYKKALNVVGK